LRLVTWNCAQAFHRKYEHLLTLDPVPDIWVIPECAKPEIVKSKAPGFLPRDWRWVGRYPHKGLAVFSFGGTTLEDLNCGSDALRYFLPVRVKGVVDVDLVAVWAFDGGEPPRAVPNSPALGSAVRHFEPLLRGPLALMAGDFNAGIQFDQERTRTRFSDVNRRLNELGLQSAVHQVHGGHCEDDVHTYFDRSRCGKPFHIDYVYYQALGDLRLRSATVGLRDDWREWSDHAPIIVDFEIEPPPTSR
jgi:hypothetical protein